MLQVVVVANSTNKTWLSSNDLQTEDGRRKLNETPKNPVTTTTSVREGDTLKGQKLDDSEVVVLSPVIDRHSPVDIYEQSKFCNYLLT